MAGLFASRFAQVNALAQSNCTSDYKVLVCIFLFGGNDGNNMIVPVTTPSNPNNSYAAYAALRKGIALPSNSLIPVGTPAGDTYGFHANLVELASIYASQRLAVLANVGTLVQPLTRAQYRAPGAVTPNNLFSHLDQQQQWQSSIARGIALTGWGGRAADVMQSCNTPSAFPTVTSVGGTTLLTIGAQSNPATFAPNAPIGLRGSGSNTGARDAAFQQLLTFDNGLKLVQAANAITAAGLNNANQLAAAMSGAPPMATTFPSTSIGSQLQQVAKIIQVRSRLNVHRQIFFAFLGGFDTHNSQVHDQAALFAQLSPAMSAFYNATVELGVFQSVTTFTESDFGRTLQPSSGAGTDHAWGSHHMIMGGAVQGGRVYGSFPTLALQGPDDAASRGSWIPSTATDQYAATLASWFGVNTSSLPFLFPNLSNFPTANLGFV